MCYLFALPILAEVLLSYFQFLNCPLRKKKLRPLKRNYRPFRILEPHFGKLLTASETTDHLAYDTTDHLGNYRLSTKKAALDRVYPLVRQIGYLFHLYKNIYKHVQEEDVSQLYLTDDEFGTNITMSFVLVQDILPSFDALSNYAGDQEQAILDYFETTYIGELRRGRRLTPRFLRDMWNMNLRVQNGLPRTNNDLQGLYNRFSGDFQQRHAHIWKFIQGLKSDSAMNHHTMTQILVGAPLFSAM